MKRILLTALLILLVMLPVGAVAAPSELPANPRLYIAAALATTLEGVLPLVPIAPNVPQLWLPLAINNNTVTPTLVFLHLEDCRTGPVSDPGPVADAEIEVEFSPSGRHVKGKTNVDGNFFSMGPLSGSVILHNYHGENITIIVIDTDNYLLAKAVLVYCPQ